MEFLAELLEPLGFEHSTRWGHTWDLENMRIIWTDEDVQVIAFTGRPGWSPVAWEFTLQMGTPRHVVKAAILAAVEDAVDA